MMISLVDSCVTPDVRVVSDLADAKWDAYVQQHPDATAYHLSAWPRLLARVFRRDFRMLATTSEGRVTGVLPIVGFHSRVFGTFAVSLPFVNYGGVLADDEVSARALVNAAIQVTRGWGGSHLELRHFSQQFPDLRAKRHKVAMTLPLLDTADAQWLAIDRKIRNQVRKAEKSGITVTVGGVEDVEAFYGVFSQNMRDLGTPVYPLAFFREMLETFPRTSRVFIARLDGQPIAGAVAQSFRGVFEVPSASSLREHRALCPNILMYWEMVKFAISSGARIFDFGRSTKDEGTFHFKKQWGAEPGELVWEYWTAGDAALPEISPGNPKYRTAISVWQRLPLAVTNTLGPRIVRNIP